MKPLVSVLASTALSGVLLFGLAGTVAWWNAWAFLGVMLAVGVLSTRAIAQSPDLAYERRTAAAQAPPWDRLVVRLTSFALPAVLVLAALEHRIGWLPPVAPAVSVLAFLLMVPAVTLTYRALAVNAFFSSHVRIQSDRGHSVVSSGPYGRIRHPGYAGSVVFNLLSPLALGSWAALVPGAFAAALLVWRTAREDRFLRTHLTGYAEYAAQVRHRLVPGLWAVLFLLVTGLVNAARAQTHALEEVRVIEDERIADPFALVEVEGGALFLSDPLAQGLFRISPHGEWLRVASLGEGPGEVEVLAGFSLRGDTVCALDPGSRSLVLFTTEGEYLQELHVDVARLLAVYPLSFPFLLLPGGEIVTVPSFPRNDGTPGLPQSAPFLRFTREGALRDTLMLWNLGVPTHARLETGAWPPPAVPEFFLSAPTVAADRRGTYLVSVEESESGLRFTSRSLPGGRETVREVAVERIPLRGDAVDDVVSRWAESKAPGLHLQPARLEGLVRDAITIPEYEPLFTEVVAGVDGFLWLRGFTAGDEVLWTRYSLGGEPPASVELRAGDEVMDAGKDWLWIVRRDALDVATLVRMVLRAEKGGPGGDRPSPATSPSALAADTVGEIVTVRNGAAGLWREGEGWKLETGWRVPLRGEGEDGRMGLLTSVSLGPDGRSYVLDLSERAVHVFDQAGQPVGRLSGGEAEPGLFEGPLAQAWDPMNRLRVSDGWPGRYVVFDTTGTVMKTVPRPVRAFAGWNQVMAFEEGGDFLEQTAWRGEGRTLTGSVRLDTAGGIADTLPPLPALDPASSRGTAEGYRTPTGSPDGSAPSPRERYSP